MRYYTRITTMLLVLICATKGMSQSIDLEHAGNGFTEKNLLKLNGNASASGIYYAGNNAENERLPLTYFINGNINVRIADLIDMPVSYVLTNVGGNFQYPSLPSRLAIHPTYKWATAHIGNVSMVFSPYTLNGYLFDGVGVELQPGKWRIAAMTGRLQRAQNYDTGNAASPAAYHRTGQGAKVGYVTDKYRISYTFFHAKDDAGSIAVLPPDSLNIRPQSNLVTSLEGSVRIIKGLDLQGEYANTALTTNTNDNTKVNKKDGAFQLSSPFVKEMVSTEYHSALRTNLNYAFLKSVVGLGYERVDPGYRTLGAYYFNNDLVSYTVNYVQRMLHERMSLTMALGLQHDNLEGGKAATSNRTVGMINVSYFPGDKFNAIASYSNFLTYANVQSRFQYINQLNPYQYIDTLNFSQISQNAMLNTNIALLKAPAIAHNLNVSLNYMAVQDKNGTVVNAGSSSGFYNGAVSWVTQFVPQKITASLGYNVSRNEVGANNFTTQGPIGSVAWQLLQGKLLTSLSLSYNNTSGAATQQGSVINSRFNARYTLHKKQQISLSFLGQERSAALNGYSDRVTTLTYEVSF